MGCLKTTDNLSSSQDPNNQFRITCPKFDEFAVSFVDVMKKLLILWHSNIQMVHSDAYNLFFTSKKETMNDNLSSLKSKRHIGTERDVFCIMNCHCVVPQMVY